MGSIQNNVEKTPLRKVTSSEKLSVEAYSHIHALRHCIFVFSIECFFVRWIEKENFHRRY